MTRRFALPLALALAIGLSLPVVALAADPADNIPGVPLAGPISTGLLGGPIYDRVYSVDVPADRVLLISLTGSEGTDFDLYLFDASATSVYSTTGLVAKSTGPSSNEVLAFPSPAGGRYYIDLSGFTEVEGEYRLTVQIATDSTPPRISLVIDGGAPATANPDASVTVIAIDDLSGVGAMQFSPDGITWGPWQPYVSQTTWSFTGPDGTKRLWARARDYQGNVSAPTTASLTLDRVAPAIVDRWPAPNGSVPAPRPTISVTFSEPIRPSSWMAFGLILQDSFGTVIYGSYTWDAATDTGSFQPGSDLQVGGVYVVSLGPIVDLAGNQIPPPGSWTIRPLEAPKISLAASPRATTRGASVMLSGTVDLRLGGTFSLERLQADGGWLPIEAVLPDRTGAYFSEQTVFQNTTFRVAYSGNEVSAATVSPGARVLVRRSLSLGGPAASVLRSASIGQRNVVSVTLSPVEPSVPVTMTLSRVGPARGTSHEIARIVRASAAGRATFAWRALTPGVYTVRVTSPATDSFAGGASPTYRWTVE